MVFAEIMREACESMMSNYFQEDASMLFFDFLITAESGERTLLQIIICLAIVIKLTYYSWVNEAVDALTLT